ncbi:phosphatase PAP2 family protein [Persicimonas caeni]|uniref:phosphatase PAP2 family protein n=1 Tax=Persicimonas caeni TaxID=2292766 RepID=UPI00143D75D2|nr:phosphatase PAP2 family protein [Persicimonas caeni]
MRPSLLAIALAVLTVVTPVVTFAQEGDSSADPSAQARPLDEPADGETGATPDSNASTSTEVRWNDNWEKVRWWQYPTAVGLNAFGFTARFALDDPEPNWEGTISIDQEILDAIAVRDDPWRSNLIEVSDIGFFGSMAYRAFDSVIVPGYLHDNWEVAWQLAWIDLQAFGTVAAVLWGTQLYVGRVRPTSANCDDPERRGSICDPESSEYARSFIAGHPATAITAAGLTCLHHEHMPLYGGGFADDLACGVMIGNAVVNGFTRVMTEHHYPSDLLFGTVLGLTAGWVLPTALHYGWGDDEDDAAETARLPKGEPDSSTPVFTFSPSVIDDEPALMLLGRF